MLNRLLDGLASRVGLAFAVSAVVAVSTAAAVYFDAAAARLDANQRRFDEGRLRHAVVAISDIQRATLILQTAAVENALSPRHRDNLSTALDILYVRAESMRPRPGPADHAARMLPGIRDRMIALVAQGDALLAAHGDTYARRAESFLSASDDLRRALVRYIDEQRRVENEVIDRQTAVLREQWTVLMAALPLLSLTVIGALLLLRREVLSRHAREEAEARVHFLAFFDPLTGLANRVQFQDRACELIAGSGPVTLMLVDLDGFKAINDTHGHAAGDAVLVHVAGILREEAARDGGTAARLGGDEFAVVLPTDAEGPLSALCERVLGRLAESLEAGADRVAIGASLGLAASTQLSSAIVVNYESLSRVTDFALYASKLAGRGRYTFYDKALERRFLERRAMLEELPMAVERGDLEVFLQPKYALDIGRVSGFEALVRWRRHGRLVAPADFIRLAEESGTIGEIDFFMLAEASRTLARWNETHGTDYTVSVNLSAMHFIGRSVVSAVRAALRDSGLPPQQLTLEITESVQIHDWENVGRVLAAFREIGCRVSIDDFGTGYSSLAHVRALDADELKIDRSLLNEIEESDAARFVLDAVVDLAGNFGMEVVAEGVETLRQAEIVAAIGVRTIQGFLVGEPLPAPEALGAARDYRLDQAPVPSAVTPSAGPAAQPPPPVPRAQRQAAGPGSPSRRGGAG